MDDRVALKCGWCARDSRAGQKQAYPPMCLGSQQAYPQTPQLRPPQRAAYSASESPRAKMQSVCAKMQACTLRAGRPASAPVAGRAAPLAARTAVRGAALEAKQASVSCSAQRSEALVTVCGSMQAGIGLLGNKAGSAQHNSLPARR